VTFFVFAVLINQHMNNQRKQHQTSIQMLHIKKKKKKKKIPNKKKKNREKTN